MHNCTSPHKTLLGCTFVHKTLLYTKHSCNALEHPGRKQLCTPKRKVDWWEVTLQIGRLVSKLNIVQWTITRSTLSSQAWPLGSFLAYGKVPNYICDGGPQVLMEVLRSVHRWSPERLKLNPLKAPFSLLPVFVVECPPKRQIIFECPPKRKIIFPFHLVKSNGAMWALFII